jgi:hypothetical protein
MSEEFNATSVAELPTRAEAQAMRVRLNQSPERRDDTGLPTTAAM